MNKAKTFLIFILYLQISSSKSPFDDACGDWVPYKDEKCLKIYDQNLATYTDAENICKNEEGALLPSIITEEKQQFMETFLKSYNVVDNVWIGLRFANESYVWEDGTVADYTHWTSGSPNNDPTYCVQMETEDNLFGYWTDVACTKKNLVICEKLQLWSLSKLQSTVMNMALELSNDKSTIENIQETLTNVVENPVPIGFIYVQLPKEKPPQEIWSGMQWLDISSDYAGLFFRTEGGNSAAFGEIQNESSPRLAKVKRVYSSGVDPSPAPGDVLVPADGTESDQLLLSYDYSVGPEAQRYMKFQLSKEEVCPRNMAMKIWKRTS